MSAGRSRRCAPATSSRSTWRDRSINAELSDAEIAERLKTWSPPPRDYPRGYNRLFAQHVRQAHEGCDFDFLEGTEPLPEPEIH